jgi:hypothetical protein
MDDIHQMAAKPPEHMLRCGSFGICTLYNIGTFPTPAAIANLRRHSGVAASVRRWSIRGPASYPPLLNYGNWLQDQSTPLSTAKRTRA